MRYLPDDSLAPEGHNSGFTDPEMQKADDALHYLQDTAPAFAAAAGERVYLTEFRKSMKAILMAENNDRPVSVQERDAYQHPRYLKLLQALKQAEIAYQELLARRLHAEHVIRVYQSNKKVAKL